MIRATKSNPCPICKKGDWCLIGKDAAICMRISSQKEHLFSNHAIGWFHPLKEPRPNWTPPPKRETPKLRCAELLEEWRHSRWHRSLTELAESLGVEATALDRLGCVWAPEHRAWAFPMRGGTGEYNGIRLRADNGAKWAVLGSREGVFYTFGNPNGNTLYVVEGPTDAAAGLSIGLDMVGRPSCYGGVDEIRQIVRNHKFKRVVVISDNDTKPDAQRNNALGRKGLTDHLFVPYCVVTLPCKDLRQLVNNGGGRGVLEYMVSNTVWNNNR